MNARILLVEDEPDLVLTVSDLLRGENYDVESATDGEAGLSKALTGGFDLILLDLMLPKRSGYDVCRALREKGLDTAVLMLTARSQVVDRVLGLKLGADDYLVKPFDPAELLARVEALLRRVRKSDLIPVQSIRFGSVEVDFERAQTRRNGEPVALAGKELQLLRYLVNRRGQVVAREELMREVWGYAGEVSSRTLDVHVAWLRQKLEKNPQAPEHIQTIRGKGYRFIP